MMNFDYGGDGEPIKGERAAWSPPSSTCRPSTTETELRDSLGCVGCIRLEKIASCRLAAVNWNSYSFKRARGFRHATDAPCAFIG